MYIRVECTNDVNLHNKIEIHQELFLTEDEKDIILNTDEYHNVIWSCQDEEKLIGIDQKIFETRVV
jgi:hypothetical protein